MTTEILELDEIIASQAQKEVAHNTALRQIEGRLVRALSKALAVPPSSPAEGASYIVAAGGSGAWTGQAGKIAHFFGGAWKFWQPIEGVRLWICDEDAEYVYDGAAWMPNGGDASADIAAAIAAHEAASNPHPTYLTAAEGSAAYDAAGAAASAVTAHAAADDPHPQYLTQTEGDARYASTTSATGGTVTNVALTTPGVLFNVTGSPVTTSGTLAMSLKTQVKNTFLAGPASGADAAPTMRALVAADLPAQPFDLTAFYPGVPSASAIVTRVPVARAVTFPASLAGSIGMASVAATAQADFDVQKNGASVGTIRFAAAATSATFIAASAVTLAAGDVLSVIAPATADSTLANVGFVLAGSR